MAVLRRAIDQDLNIPIGYQVRVFVCVRVCACVCVCVCVLPNTGRHTSTSARDGHVLLDHPHVCVCVSVCVLVPDTHR